MYFLWGIGGGIEREGELHPFARTMRKKKGKKRKIKRTDIDTVSIKDFTCLLCTRYVSKSIFCAAYHIPRHIVFPCTVLGITFERPSLVAAALGADIRRTQVGALMP
jgi:hypothetical protein